MTIMTLYGKDTKGNVKVWEVTTNGSQVLVSHGRLGGKLQVKTTICTGKNIGRSNETTPEEQAQLEAEAKYKKQLDKLYRPTIEELEEVGNNLPMLAHDYTKVGYRLNYPCYVSPKLDGVRCLATLTNSGPTFTSRGGKEYKVPDHLYRALSEICPDGDGEIVLDGELYIHGLQLNQIVSAVKNVDNPNHHVMEFHVFDVPSEKPFSDRYLDLCDIERHYGFDGIVRMVKCSRVDREEEARGWLATHMNNGFEGIMLRNPEGPYTFNHRSSDLQKWKEFKDCEAQIVSVDCDKNNEAVFNCRLPNDITFKCKMRGSHAERLFEIHSGSSEGRWITVRYQQLTEFGVLQFPVGIAFRDCDSEGNPLE